MLIFYSRIVLFLYFESNRIGGIRNFTISLKIVIFHVLNLKSPQNCLINFKKYYRLSKSTTVSYCLGMIIVFAEVLLYFYFELRNWQPYDCN